MKFKSIFAALAAALACAAMAGPAVAQDRICRGQAEGEGTLDVSVLFRVDAAGVISNRWAVWTPKMIGRTRRDWPGLMIYFDHPTAFGIGQPSRVQAFAFGDRFPTTSRLRFRISWGENVWRSPVDHLEPSGRYQFIHSPFAWTGGMARNSGLISRLEQIGVADVVLEDAGGRALLTSTWDLSDRSTRAELFDKAWAKAVKAYDAWQACKPASATRGDEA